MEPHSVLSQEPNRSGWREDVPFLVTCVGLLLSALFLTSGSDQKASSLLLAPVTAPATADRPQGQQAATTSVMPSPVLAATTVPLPTAVPSPTLRPASTSAPTRLRIPRIGVDADVVEVGYEITEDAGSRVTTWEVAEYAAGFHRGSAYPGHPGNIVISGHNNIRGRVFRHLVDLRPGDDVYLYAEAQEHHYVVSQRLLVLEKGMSPGVRTENAAWILPTQDERLTLVSCWPFVKPDHRVVVVAFPAL